MLITSLSSLAQGAEGVPVPHCTEDPLHDQLEGSEAAAGHPAGRLVVPGGVDVGCVPEPRAEPGPDHGRTHSRGAAVQHVSAGHMGLHDGRRCVRNSNILVLSRFSGSRSGLRRAGRAKDLARFTDVIFGKSCRRRRRKTAFTRRGSSQFAPAAKFRALISLY